MGGDLWEVAAAANGVPVAAVKGRDLHADVCRARKQVYAVLRAAGWSLPQIGRFVGRDHTTVRSGAVQAPWEAWMDTAPVPATPPDGRDPARQVHRELAEPPVAKRPALPGSCVDCGGEPMPGGTLRCLDCFHVWLTETRGPRWGQNPVSRIGRDHHRPAVRQVATPRGLFREVA